MIRLGSIEQYKLREGGYTKNEHGYGNKGFSDDFCIITNRVIGYGYGLFYINSYLGKSSVDYYDITNTLVGLCIQKVGIDNNINYYL